MHLVPVLELVQEPVQEQPPSSWRRTGSPSSVAWLLQLTVGTMHWVGMLPWLVLVLVLALVLELEQKQPPSSWQTTETPSSLLCLKQLLHLADTLPWRAQAQLPLG